MPPRCGVTIMRSVWLARISGTGKPAASNGVNESVGLAVQLATQCSGSEAEAVATPDGATSSKPRTRTTALLLRLSVASMGRYARRCRVLEQRRSRQQPADESRS